MVTLVAICNLRNHLKISVYCCSMTILQRFANQQYHKRFVKYLDGTLLLPQGSCLYQFLSNAYVFSALSVDDTRPQKAQN